MNEGIGSIEPEIRRAIGKIGKSSVGRARLLPSRILGRFSGASSPSPQPSPVEGEGEEFSSRALWGESRVPNDDR